MDSLTKLLGQHKHFEPDVPPVTTATERFFAERRRMLFPSADGGAVDAPQSSGIELLQPWRPVSDGLPSISVVIVPRYPGPLLESTLEAVLETAPESAEIIAVGDSGAVRDTRVTVVARPSANDRVAAITAGCARARGDVVVLCDGGVRPNPGWANVFCEALKRSDAGVVGPALVYGEGNTVHGLTLRTACLNVDWIRAAPSTEPFAVTVVPGAMMAFRREVLEAVGGFDPGMTGVGGEDTEFCIRLWRAGYVCLNVPSASAAVQFEEGAEDLGSHGIPSQSPAARGTSSVASAGAAISRTGPAQPTLRRGLCTSRRLGRPRPPRADRRDLLLRRRLVSAPIPRHRARGTTSRQFATTGGNMSSFTLDIASPSRSRD